MTENYSFPLSDAEIQALAEFTIGGISGTEGHPVGELPEAIPLPAVQATVEGRVSNWEEIDDNEYQLLVMEIKNEAERIIGY